MRFPSLLVLFILLFCYKPEMLARDRYADSLRDVVKSQIPDTSKVNALLELSTYYLGTNNGEANKYAIWAKNLSFEAGFSKGLAYAYKYIGIVHYYNSEYVQALEQWEKSYNVFDSIQDKVGMSNMLSNIGAIYFNQGDNAKALDYYLHSLRLAEETGDKLRITTAMQNVGAVYAEKPATHDLAISYYTKSLKYSEEIGDQEAIGTVSVNLGEMYLERGDDELALAYFERSLSALEGTDGIPYSLISIGKVYVYRKDLNRAIEYFQKAYDIARATQVSIDIARSLVAMASAYNDLGRYQEALKSLKTALPAAAHVKANKELKDIYQGLAQTYSSRNNFDSAYKYLDLYTNIKDTLFNEATDKKLSSLMFNFELEKKENEIESLTKEKELTDINLQRQALIRNLIIAGFLSTIIFLFVTISQKKKITGEKKRSDDLLLNILPNETAIELKQKGYTTAKKFDNATILFSDIKNFTMLSEIFTPEKLVEELDTYFRAFDEIMTRHGLEKIKTVGDGYIAAGGLPENNKAKAKDVVQASKEMMAKVEELKIQRIDKNLPFFEIRVGINSGPVVAGVVGVKKFQYDIWGDTVNTAARMEQNSVPGKINISENTYHQVKEYFACEDRGLIEVKGKGMLRMFYVN
jgi:adenylate cyclase